MLCRACEENDSRTLREERRDEIRPPAPKKREKSDGLCSRCGHLLGPEDMTRRVQAKESQLKRFGLAGERGSLLKRKPKGGN
jgi:hypothetical protein